MVDSVPETSVEVEKKPKTKVALPAGIVLVRATRGSFVDLVKNVHIGSDFQPVEMHPWLQAQVASGLIEAQK